MEGARLNYRLRRSKLRRTLALSIGTQGLIVYAPWSLSLGRIETFVLGHAGWIAQKLAKQASCVVAGMAWQDGIGLRLLGETVTLRVSAHVTAIEQNNAMLYVPAQAANHLQQVVIAWYRQRALAYFNDRMRLFSARLPRQPAALKISSAQSRWGSCTRSGIIRLNWRLLQAPAAEADYVLAHELAHLTHLNHSPAFWQEVARLCPGYAAQRLALRTEGHRYLQISL